MIERQLSACSHKWLSNTCKKCGVNQYQGDHALKTICFESLLNCSSSKYLRHMRKRKCPIIEVKEISESTALLIDAICEKFQYGIQTRTLAMFIYAKTCQKQQKNEKFWASAALMVASKGIQLDKRVPYLNRYQRYADKSFPQEDYELAQKIIFQEMNFDIQYATFLSFIHFYLTAGVVFQSDNITEAQVRAIEDQLILQSKIMIRHGYFLQFQPEKLATSMIKQARLKFQIEGWNKNLVRITGIESQEIDIIEKANDVLKPLNVMQMKNREKIISVSHNSYNNYQSTKATVLGSIQNTLSTTTQAKLAKICRKKLENTMKVQYNPLKDNNVKQNSMKVMQQPIKTTLRSQNYSLSKMPLTCSTDRLIPFSMFASRR